MAIIGWWRSFSSYNVLFLHLKNTGKNCKHRENTGNFTIT